MPAHDVYTVNAATPWRRWWRPYVITLSDVVTDKNLQVNSQPYRFIQNTGAAGLVVIAWEPDATEVSIFLGQGEILEGGLWRHAKTTGSTVGATSLRGFTGSTVP